MSWARARRHFSSQRWYSVSLPTLSSSGWGIAVLDAFVADLIADRFTLQYAAEDLPRARALIERYADLPLGLVDAAVIACAERNGGRVLTLDLRHFSVVAREGTITVLP